ncbi:MAG TPA: DNA polymerase III subunit [Vicinamibacterales bacterium]|nr:DNA polymerase III subunit [Vicinamibacterales bacterium]
MTLRDIIGHRRLTTLIARAIERDSLPPTLLFAGPSGVGKWAVARATAQAVNCLERVGGGELPVDACGKCRACDRIARGVHVDVIMLEPDDRASIKIDVVRDVLSKTGFRPFEGRKRVVLIREADTLEPASQNSLLKSLEEPPPGTMFILTTAVPGALLPTVRSRCMRLRFGRLTASEVSTALQRDHEYSDAEALQAAPLADGSLGQALALIDNDLSMFRELAIGLLQQSAGRGDAQARAQAASALHTGGSKKERTREDVALVLRLMASMLRDLEAINAGADRAVLANPLLTRDLEALARSFSGDRARAAFGAVDRALTALERNAGTKVVTEWLAVQM